MSSADWNGFAHYALEVETLTRTSSVLAGRLPLGIVEDLLPGLLGDPRVDLESRGFGVMQEVEGLQRCSNIDRG